MTTWPMQGVVIANSAGVVYVGGVCELLRALCEIEKVSLLGSMTDQQMLACYANTYAYTQLAN